jgi:hypothetical protein
MGYDYDAFETVYAILVAIIVHWDLVVSCSLLGIVPWSCNSLL